MKKRFVFHLILLTFAIFTLIPLWVMLTTSFKTSQTVIGIQSIFPDFSNMTYENFVDVWLGEVENPEKLSFWDKLIGSGEGSGKFGRYFLNSFIVSVSITLANMLFDTMAAYALARRKFQGRTLIMSVIIAKLMIPSAVLMVPTFILVNNLHLYDTYLALILPVVAETFGIFLLRQYMLSLPIELEEAARLEGASDWRILFTIIMPLCKPALAVVVIHSVMTSWNAYVYPLILTSSDSMRTLPLGIAFYRASHSGVDAGHLMAGSVITALPIILIFLIFQRQIISGLTRRAVKG